MSNTVKLIIGIVAVVAVLLGLVKFRNSPVTSPAVSPSVQGSRSPLPASLPTSSPTTPKPTPKPSVSKTPTPTATPSVVPTPSPMPTPSPSQAPTPTPTPTAKPTPEPTITAISPSTISLANGKTFFIEGTNFIVNNTPRVTGAKIVNSNNGNTYDLNIGSADIQNDHEIKTQMPVVAYGIFDVSIVSIDGTVVTLSRGLTVNP